MIGPESDSYGNFYRDSMSPTTHISFMPDKEEDALVLTALTAVLSHLFLLEGIFVDESFGFEVSFIKGLIPYVLNNRGKVQGLYKIDFTLSFGTLDKKMLLNKLKPVVRSDPVFQLVRSYFDIPYIDRYGKDVTSKYRDNNQGIPPYGCIGIALLHFALADFDREFQKLYPGIYYCRFLHLSCTDLSVFDKNQILKLFSKHSLVGTMSYIEAGDPPIQSQYGLIWIDKEGRVHHKKNLLKKLIKS